MSISPDHEGVDPSLREELHAMTSPPPQPPCCAPEAADEETDSGSAEHSPDAVPSATDTKTAPTPAPPADRQDGPSCSVRTAEECPAMDGRQVGTAVAREDSQPVAAWQSEPPTSPAVMLGSARSEARDVEVLVMPSPDERVRLPESLAASDPPAAEEWVLPDHLWMVMRFVPSCAAAVVFLSYRHWWTGIVCALWLVSAAGVAQGRTTVRVQFVVVTIAAPVATHVLEGGLQRSACAVAATGLALLPLHQSELLLVSSTVAVCVGLCVVWEIVFRPDTDDDWLESPVPSRARTLLSLVNISAGAVAAFCAGRKCVSSCDSELADVVCSAEMLAETLADYRLGGMPEPAEGENRYLILLLHDIAENLRIYRPFLPEALFTTEEEMVGSDDIVDDEVTSPRAVAATIPAPQSRTPGLVALQPSQSLSVLEVSGRQSATSSQDEEQRMKESVGSPTASSLNLESSDIISPHHGLPRNSSRPTGLQGVGGSRHRPPAPQSLNTRKVAVMISNLCGTNSLVGRLSIDEFNSVFTAYVGGVSDVAKEQRGVLHNTLGDRLLFGFGTVGFVPSAQARACRCALETVAKCAELARSAPGRPESFSATNKRSSLVSLTSPTALQGQVASLQMKRRVLKRFTRGSSGSMDPPTVPAAPDTSAPCFTAVCAGEALVGHAGSLTNRSFQVIGHPPRAAAALASHCKKLNAAAACDHGSASQAHDVISVPIDVMNMYGKRATACQLLRCRTALGSGEWMYQIAAENEQRERAVLVGYKDVFREVAHGHYANALNAIVRLCDQHRIEARASAVYLSTADQAVVRLRERISCLTGIAISKREVTSDCFNSLFGVSIAPQLQHSGGSTQRLQMSGSPKPLGLPGNSSVRRFPTLDKLRGVLPQQESA
eukprot:TRINITY_DN24339_c0_g1_i1.p1 TRINITY_DN24339_c0_g1~~TRINITY_DN24339_c0_g1_i1.p1  ORF type:complete len:954 (+),score=60.53 TRINITY_DN24339_c0_g1_i1:187-2862(+)